MPWNLNLGVTPKQAEGIFRLAEELLLSDGVPVDERHYRRAAAKRSEKGAFVMPGRYHQVDYLVPRMAVGVYVNDHYIICGAQSLARPVVYRLLRVYAFFPTGHQSLARVFSAEVVTRKTCNTEGVRFSNRGVEYLVTECRNNLLRNPFHEERNCEGVLKHLKRCRGAKARVLQYEPDEELLTECELDPMSRFGIRLLFDKKWQNYK